MNCSMRSLWRGRARLANSLLPPDHQVQIPTEGLARTVADYIAGMTDRYAIREYRRLFAVDQL